MGIRAVLPWCAALAASALAAPAAAEERSPRPHGTYQWVDPATDLAPDAVESADISNLVFINKCPGGCTITPGVNDARYDTSSIADSTAMVSEFAHGEEVFQEVVECVKEVYGPYDVEITTEDPGDSVFHHEAILAGHPSELGLPNGVGGIAPASCDPLNNVISFSFANLTGPNVEELCWTVAQESAHAFGLPNHVYNCLDPMTYLPGCGRKYFRNAAYPCGEFSEGDPPCRCGGSVQNSHRELRSTFGDGTPPPPPEVEILQPSTEDEQVQDGFSIYTTAIDPRLVERIELYINGIKYGEKPGHDYRQRLDDYYFLAPDLPDGYLNIEIRAYNDLGSEGIGSLRVLKGEPCTSTDTCFEHQECVDGACRYPDPEGQLGDTCEYKYYCESQLCPELNGDRVCSETCNPTMDGSCPQGYKCLEAGNSGVCWPKSRLGSGGGCTLTGDRGGAGGAALLLLGAAFALRRRGSRGVSI